MAVAQRPYATKGLREINACLSGDKNVLIFPWGKKAPF